MDRLLNLLGLCARAGRMVTGEKACIEKIRAGGACVALLDGAAANNAVKSMTDACQHKNVPLIRTPAYALGDAVGKPGRMACVVTDPGFARSMLKLYQPTENAE